MPKGRGPVVLEDEMAEPGESIAGDRRSQKPAPIRGSAGGGECCHSEDVPR